jgi:UDP-glucose 4-epimerase
MRIAVTGLSGNVGTALLRRLDATPNGPSVLGVVRRPPPAAAPYTAAEWVALDLARQDAAERLTSLFDGVDAVVHLAWGFQPARNATYLARATVGATSSVLRAAQAAGVAHLVHMSSIGVYSPAHRTASATPPAVREDHARLGIPTLPYSRQKVAAEQLLDDYEQTHPSGNRMAIARLRPGLVLQRAAGSALLRYGTPAWFPSAVLGLVPVLPLDRRLTFSAVHSDDVASAVEAVLSQRARGAFNLAADPALTRDDVAQALGARAVHVPMRVVRAATALTWHARLQPLDPGWMDLASASPLLDCTRARRELGWVPAVDARDALRDAVSGLREQASTESPALRRRTVPRSVARVLSAGTVSRRALP